MILQGVDEAGDDRIGWIVLLLAAVLVAVAAGAEKPSLDELHHHMEEHFAKWQLPDDVIWVDELPMTATGKVSKLTLRKNLGDYKLPDLR